MKSPFLRILKYIFTSVFLILFFTSCSNIAKSVASKTPVYHKNIIGSNDFNSLIENLLENQKSKLNKYSSENEVVLVPDFVNINRLKNRSKLGFLLSEQLKNSLSNRGVIIREIELGKDFQFGPSGFNVLTRNQKDIKDNEINSHYAFVGTYSITTESLIVFIKLIDITTGNILSSAYSETIVDDEIMDLERSSARPLIFSPMVL